MRTAVLNLAAAAAILALTGVARAQTKKDAQPEGVRPTNTAPKPPGDKASDPPRNLNTPNTAPMPATKPAPNASGVGSGSAGTVEGRKDGTTNSNSKGEPPKSR